VISLHDAKMQLCVFSAPLHHVYLTLLVAKGQQPQVVSGSRRRRTGRPLQSRTHDWSNVPRALLRHTGLIASLALRGQAHRSLITWTVFRTVTEAL